MQFDYRTVRPSEGELLPPQYSQEGTSVDAGLYSGSFSVAASPEASREHEEHEKAVFKFEIKTVL